MFLVRFFFFFFLLHCLNTQGEEKHGKNDCQEKKKRSFSARVTIASADIKKAEMKLALSEELDCKQRLLNPSQDLLPYSPKREER